MPFCNECGKEIPDEFAYVICDGCFGKIRNEILNPPKRVVEGGAGFVAGNANYFGFTGHVGLCSAEVVNYPAAYFIYSERAKRYEDAIRIEKMREEISKKKLLKRLIRF